MRAFLAGLVLLLLICFGSRSPGQIGGSSRNSTFGSGILAGEPSVPSPSSTTPPKPVPSGPHEVFFESDENGDDEDGEDSEDDKEEEPEPPKKSKKKKTSDDSTKSKSKKKKKTDDDGDSEDSTDTKKPKKKPGFIEVD